MREEDRASRFNERWKEMDQIMKDLMDLSIADETNTLPIDGPIGKVQFTGHLRDYHNWNAADWMSCLLQGGGELLWEMHDSEHEAWREMDTHELAEVAEDTVYHTHFEERKS